MLILLQSQTTPATTPVAVNKGLVIAVCVICLFLMATYICAMANKFYKRKHESLAVVKDLKRGSFAFIYFVAIPLFIIGCLAEGRTVGHAIFEGVTNSVKLIVLEYNYSDIATLFYGNTLFRATMDICYALVVLNALIFIATLVGEKFRNWSRKHSVLHFNKPLLLIAKKFAKTKTALLTNRTKWCSARQQKTVAGTVHLDFDDCNSVSVGFTSTQVGRKLSNHSTDTISREVALSFDKLSESYNAFIKGIEQSNGAITIPSKTKETLTYGNGKEFLDENGKKIETDIANPQFSCYSTLLTNTQKVFEASYFSLVNQPLFEEQSSALLVLKHKSENNDNHKNEGKQEDDYDCLSIAFGDAQLENDKHKMAICRIFGFDNFEAFVKSLKVVNTVYNKNYAGASPLSRLVYNGAVYTETGSFIMPFVFACGDDKLFAFVHLLKDSTSIWVNDFALAFKLAHIQDNKINPTISNDVSNIICYGRCKLFVTPLSKKQLKMSQDIDAEAIKHQNENNKKGELSQLEDEKILHGARYFVIVGYNEHNIAIIKSINKINNRKNHIFLACPPSEEITSFVFHKKISHLSLNKGDNLGDLIENTFGDFENKEVKIIINSGEDTDNLMYIEQLHGVISKQNLSSCSIDNHYGLYAYVFGELENSSTFSRFVKDTNGCVQYVNRHKLIAMDFVDKYPLTQYMTEEHIDYLTATIKPNVDINVVMLGFGKSNQQLFLTSVANNQFMQIENDTLCQKKVSYHIYDKLDSRNDKNLNHNYARFEKEFLSQLSNEDKDNYLPMPDLPANTTREMFHKLDINSVRFYNSIKRQLTPQEGRIAYNYIVIAAGDDLDNLDLTEKITAKLAEWDLASSATASTHVFVKISNDNLCTEVIDKNFAITKTKSHKFVTYGNQNATVYNISQIIGERFSMMARDKHISYSATDLINPQSDTTKTPGYFPLTEFEAKKKAWKIWYEYDETQRQSNIYACMSIRMKLHLLGFDYAPKSSAELSRNEDFKKIYELNDPIVYATKKCTVDGKQIFDRSGDFVEGSLRQTYAIQEHQRWNAYMITCGFIPATKKQISQAKHKNFEIRYHGNLTTFEGLKDFAIIRFLGDNYQKIDSMTKKEKEAYFKKAKKYDVIQYDYDLMDDLVWMLNRHGYQIIKKKNC